LIAQTSVDERGSIHGPFEDSDGPCYFAKCVRKAVRRISPGVYVPLTTTMIVELDPAAVKAKAAAAANEEPSGCSADRAHERTYCLGLIAVRGTSSTSRTISPPSSPRFPTELLKMKCPGAFTMRTVAGFTRTLST
jgi:hypothetical protein